MQQRSEDLRLVGLEQRARGQGMVEYGLIIAAVAIAVLVALFALGPKIASLFSQTAASLQ
jgi:pilus assembly protein Flp/PilA